VTAAAAARLRGLGLIEALHVLIGFIDELVCRPCVILGILAELRAHEECAVLGAGVDIHIALIALIDPLEAGGLPAAVRAGKLRDALVSKGDGLALKALEALMAERIRSFILDRGLEVRHTRGEDARSVRVQAEPLGHIEPGSDERGVVRVAQSVMRDAGLLYFEMLHGAGERLLVLVPAGLEIIDELEVYPPIQSQSRSWMMMFCSMMR